MFTRAQAQARGIKIKWDCRMILDSEIESLVGS